MPFTRELFSCIFSAQKSHKNGNGTQLILSCCSGVDPLTPDDIAEVVVFVASRRQNVVVADTLIFPSHQVCHKDSCLHGSTHIGADK